MIYTYQKFEKIIIHLEAINKVKLILSTVAISLFIAISFTFFDKARNPVSIMDIPLYEKILLVCVLSPIVETLIFQKLLINLIIKYTNNKFISIVFSSFLFALVHNYSILYVAKIFFVGLLFGLLYVVCSRKHPALHVIVAHSIYNIIAISLSFAFDK